MNFSVDGLSLRAEVSKLIFSQGLDSKYFGFHGPAHEISLANILNFLTLVSLHRSHLAKTQLCLNQTVYFTPATEQLRTAEENSPAALDGLASNSQP